MMQLRSSAVQRLLIGGSSTSSNVAATSVSEGKDPRDGLARFREGTGGSFGNIVMVNAPGDAFIRKDCFDVTVETTRTGTVDNFFFSTNNVVVGLNAGSQLLSKEVVAQTHPRPRRLRRRRTSCTCPQPSTKTL